MVSAAMVSGKVSVTGDETLPAEAAMVQGKVHGFRQGFHHLRMLAGGDCG